ncbi:MAG: integrase arm-type DNA-binding domain-containing protein [Pseudomonadota bacterium]
MPRPAVPLTEDRIVNAQPRQKPYRLFDGSGLYLEVTPCGSKIWRMKICRTNANGLQCSLTFGHYPEVPTLLARAHRVRAKNMLREGLDPRTEFNAAKLRVPKWPDVTVPMPGWIDANKVRRCAAQIARTAVYRLQADIFPAMSRLPIDEARRSEFLSALGEIESRGMKMIARHLYELCSAVIDQSAQTGITESDMASCMLDARASERRHPR